jgi:CBS domain-containing protein
MAARARKRTQGAQAPAARAPRAKARVGQLCVRKVETVAPGVLAKDAARRMDERAVGTLVVVDELGRPLGIVTDRDLMVRCIAGGADPKRARVGRVMSGPVAWIHQDAPVEAALEEMARLRVRRLAVVDERERLVGLLALDDVLCRRLAAGSSLGRVLRRTMA